MLSVNGSPIINKVRLRMSLENVVKDIPSISDNGWTYGDLMVSAIFHSHAARRETLPYMVYIFCRKWSRGS